MNTLTKIVLEEFNPDHTVTQIVEKVNLKHTCNYQQVYQVLKVNNKLSDMPKHKNRNIGRRSRPEDMSVNDFNFCVRWSQNIWALKQGGGKCVKCGHSDPRHLVFHHKTGIKSTGIVRMLRESKYTTVDILKEIKECDLLCCHCHKDAHINTNKLTHYSDYIKELSKKP